MFYFSQDIEYNRSTELILAPESELGPERTLSTITVDPGYLLLVANIPQGIYSTKTIPTLRLLAHDPTPHHRQGTVDISACLSKNYLNRPRILERAITSKFLLTIKAYSLYEKNGGVAQMVRACGSYPQCPGFNSLHRH